MELLKEAIQRNKYYWLAVSLTIMLAYGFTLMNFSMGVDDESFDSYIFGGVLLSQGRWGGHIVKYIINIYDFIPLWRDFIGILLITLGITFWGYLIQKFSSNVINDNSITVFSCVAISCPIIADNFIFMMTTIEMGIILCLIPLALNFFFESVINKKHFKNLLFSGVLFILALAFSELAVVYFLFGVFMLILVTVYFSENKNDFSIPRVLLILLKGSLLIVVVLFLNSMITSALQSLFSVTASSYTSNYILYDFSSIGNFFDSFYRFLKVFFGLDFIWKHMGTYMAFIAAFLLLLYSFAFTIKNKKIIHLLIGVGCIFSAFSMYFITGNINLVHRIFVTNSVFTGFVFALTFMYFQNKHIFKIKLRVVTTLLIVFIVLNQTKYMNQVFYVDYQRYQLDLTKMNSIAEEIEKNNGGNSQKEIVFVGLPENYNLKLGDTEGYSIFQWDRFDGIQSELRNSSRIFRFMNLHGYNFKGLLEMDEQEIITNSVGMNQYPKDGFVKDFGDYLIVKLGPSAYELSELTLNEFYKRYIGDIKDVTFSKDWFSLEANILSLGGWAGVKGVKSSDINIQVALINDQRQYYLKTDLVIKEDDTSDVNGGLNTGYHIYSFDTNTLVSGTYDLVLIISDNKNKRLVPMGEVIQLP